MNPDTIELPSNRSFGYLFFIIFLVGSAYLWHKNLTIQFMVAFAISISMILSAVFYPSCLKPLNRAWFKIGLGLGAIISPIVLGIIYFLIFSPIALVLKLNGRDELKLRAIKTDTHWQRRPFESQDRKSHFHDQF